MKVVILNSKSSQEDLHTYGEALISQLTHDHDVVMYDDIKSDFSNIPELFNEEEKIVMFNHFALSDGFKLFSQHLPSFKNIKYLLSPYSSYSGLDLDLLKSKGIRYRNNGGANAKAVSQYAIMCMFLLLRRFNELTADGEIDGSIMGEEYNTKTAGIIGMGNVGKELVVMLDQLGIPTVYYNRTQKDVGASLVTLEDVFNQDIVFVTIATNSDTKALLSTIPSLLQPHTYLIDVTAYDEQYDKVKVLSMLEEGKFKGFALETESSMKSTKNFISTPHIAWRTIDAEKRTVENYLNRALMILRGEAEKIDFIV